MWLVWAGLVTKVHLHSPTVCLQHTPIPLIIGELLEEITGKEITKLTYKCSTSFALRISGADPRPGKLPTLPVLAYIIVNDHC